MTDIVTVFNTETISDFGELITTEAEPLACTIQYSDNIENITDAYGVETLSDAIVLIGNKINVTASDYVQTTDAFGETLMRKVLSVEFLRDLGGNVMATKLRVGIGKGFQKPIYVVRPEISKDSEGCIISRYDTLYGNWLLLNIQPNITKLHNAVDTVSVKNSMYAYCKLDTDILELDQLFVYTTTDANPDYMVRGIQVFNRYKVAHLESIRR